MSKRKINRKHSQSKAADKRRRSGRGDIPEGTRDLDRIARSVAKSRGLRKLTKITG